MELDTQGTAEVEAVTAPDAAEVPPATDQELTTDTPPAEPDAPSPDGSEAPADPASPPPVETPDTIDPFSGGEPFAFRLDGRQFTPEGAKVINDHVVIPVQTWRNQMQNLLADRPAIKEREGQYRATVQREQQARQAAETRAEALTSEIAAMFADPEKLQATYENWTVNGPRLMAEMEARAAKRELDTYRQREQHQEMERREAELEPKIQDHLGDTLEQLLTDHQVPWQDAAEQTRWADWLRSVWEDHGKDALYPRGADGRRTLDEDKLTRLFQREVNRAKAQQQVAAVTGQKKAMNAAALAAPKPKAPAPVAAPAKAPAKPRNPATGEFKKLDADEWEQQFMKTQYSKDL